MNSKSISLKAIHPDYQAVIDRAGNQHGFRVISGLLSFSREEIIEQFIRTAALIPSLPKFSAADFAHAEFGMLGSDRISRLTGFPLQVPAFCFDTFSNYKVIKNKLGLGFRGKSSVMEGLQGNMPYFEGDRLDSWDMKTRTPFMIYHNAEEHASTLLPAVIDHELCHAADLFSFERSASDSLVFMEILARVGQISCDASDAEPYITSELNVRTGLWQARIYANDLTTDLRQTDRLTAAFRRLFGVSQQMLRHKRKSPEIAKLIDQKLVEWTRQIPRSRLTRLMMQSMSFDELELKLKALGLVG